MFADDSCSIIHGNCIEEVNRKKKSAVVFKTEWFKSAGFSINPEKSELIGFGFKPDSVTINGNVVEPVEKIRFLGLTITTDLSWREHVKIVCTKIKFAAHRIRTDGALFSSKDKKKLFNAWIMGYIYSNGLAYLPFITTTQLADIQTAANSGIRAVFSLLRFGKHQVTDLGRKLKNPGVAEVSKLIILKAAWSLRDSFSKAKIEGPRTRSRLLLNLLLLNASGWNGKKVSTILVKGWNELPFDLKKESNLKK